MKNFSEFLAEDYSFRLGGSQQKGFDQNDRKKFDELKEGDVFYYWSRYKRLPLKVHFVRLWTSEEKARVVLYYSNGTTIDSCSLHAHPEQMLPTSVFSNSEYVAATNEVEFTEELKNEFKVDIKSEDIEEVK